MADRPTERGRVTTLELFFDLILVSAFTQVTSFLSHDPTWGGLVRGLLLLGALWWAWSGYAWLTNTLDPEEDAVRLAMFAAIASMLVVSLAVPSAFGINGVVFGIAYLIVRLLHLLLYAIAGRGDRDLFRAVMKIVPLEAIAPALLLIAAFLPEPVRPWVWAGALAIDYLGINVGRGRGWRVVPEHFVERFGLIVLIALGESIVAIVVGAAGHRLDAGLIGASLLGVTVAACLWWSYFDWVVFVGQALLAEATGVERVALARDVFSYLHLPMVAGVVLFAFGVMRTLADIGGRLAVVPAVALCGGIAVYFLAHVALRLRSGGGLGRGRPVATILLLALIPVAMVIPAVGALGSVAAICVGLIAYEVLRHRASRTWIRNRRGDFTLDEARRVAENDRLRRRAAPEGPTG